MTVLPSTPGSKAIAKLSGAKWALFEHRKRHYGQTFRSIIEATPAVRSRLAGVTDADGRTTIWAPEDDAAFGDAFNTFTALLGDRPPACFPALPPAPPLAGTLLAETIGRDDPLTAHCERCLSDLKAGDLSPAEAETRLETLERHVMGFGTDGAAKMLAAREPVEQDATPEEVAERLRRRGEHEAAEEAEWAALFPSGYWSEDDEGPEEPPPKPAGGDSTPPATSVDAGQSEAGQSAPELPAGDSRPPATTTGSGQAKAGKPPATTERRAGDSTPSGAPAGAWPAEAAPVEVGGTASVRPPELVDAADYMATQPAAPVPIVEGVFERGDKVALLGPSKTKKTFFLLELGLCVASGRPFLGFDVPRPAKVLYVNLEIKPGHLQRRLHRAGKALEIAPADFRGRLLVMNARGTGLGWRDVLTVARGAAAGGVELVIVDPLYKLVDGDENSAKDMKPVLAEFDRLATETNAAVVYSHHDAKGTPGDRDIRDRGAGSNVVARDYDAGWTLTPHRTEPGAIVVETLCRNYASPGQIVVRFEDSRFMLADDLQPEVATAMTQRSAASRGDSWLAHKAPAIGLALSRVWLKRDFQEELTRRFGLSGVQTRELFHAVRDAPGVFSVRGPNLGSTSRHFMGPRELVEAEVERLERETGRPRQRDLPDRGEA